jgi:hypothetical protein
MLIHSLADFNLYVPANAMVFSWIAGISAGLPGSVAHERPAAARMAHPPRLHRWVFTLGCLAMLYAGAWLVFLHSFNGDPRAERMFSRFGISDSSRALRALRARYGGGEGAVPAADLLEFLRRDPAAPYRWCDVGESLQKAGRTAEARYCFSRALSLGPHIPYMLIRAARFHFDQGENAEALAMMASALEGNPGFDRTVFADYDRRRIGIHDVLRHGLPPNPGVWRSYLRWLVAREGSDGAIVWTSAVQRGYADDTLAREYVAALLGKRRPDAAADAWALYAGSRSEGYLVSNRIFNGGFELDPTSSPFDWQIGARRGMTVSIDDDMCYAGRRSARIRFDGTENVASIDLSQTAFVPPGRYTFQAYVKTDRISTDQGVFFAISGTGVSATTEKLVGTREWWPVEASFQVPANAGLVAVTIRRTPSLKFDNQVRGTIWIDQVRISAETVG